MINENYLATLAAVLAIVASVLYPDNGDIIVLVVSAYLGYILGKRKPSG